MGWRETESGLLVPDTTEFDQLAGAPGCAPGCTDGVCRVCGCTDNAACPDGCYWVDDSHTLCSECEP
jgi:hypothetical protein